MYLWRGRQLDESEKKNTRDDRNCMLLIFVAIAVLRLLEPIRRAYTSMFASFQLLFRKRMAASAREQMQNERRKKSENRAIKQQNALVYIENKRLSLMKHSTWQLNYEELNGKMLERKSKKKNTENENVYLLSNNMRRVALFCSVNKCSLGVFSLFL